jgi:hypothetical protein
MRLERVLKKVEMHTVLHGIYTTFGMFIQDKRNFCNVLLWHTCLLRLF